MVELLVVIAIIGILVALLLPAIQAARESARRAECQNHLKQLALALHNYENQSGALPPAAVAPNLKVETTSGWYGRDAAFFGKQGHSWMVLILPQLEQSALYDQWDFGLTKPLIDLNGRLATIDIPDFYCPTRRRTVRPEDQEFMPFGMWTTGGTDYGACTGYGNNIQDTGDGRLNPPCKHGFGPFINFEYTGSALDPGDRAIGIIVPARSTKFSKVTDGTSQTILIGELQRITRADKHCSYFPDDGWAIGGIANLFDTQYGRLNDGFFESPGSEHPGGAQFAMADGSVHFFRDDMDSNSLRFLSSMDAGDVPFEKN